MAKVIAVCISTEKGEQKKEIAEGKLKENYGLEGDAHGGIWHRQVSLLGIESVHKMDSPVLNLKNGDFAENIVTEGIEVNALPIGSHLKIGRTAVLEITQIGKECHTGCAISQTAGDCIMPTEGVFAKVLVGGSIKKGDEIKYLDVLDPNHDFKIGVLTISDSGSRGEIEDESGMILKELLKEIGVIKAYGIIPDDTKKISSYLRNWSDKLELDLIITTGGTGFSRRDNTPEATLDVIDKDVPGIPEAIRYLSLAKTNRAMLTRLAAGIRKGTLIINFPGSPIACRESFGFIKEPLVHGLQVLRGDASNCARTEEE